MENIIEALSELIPFEKLGLKVEVAKPLSIIVITVLTLLIGFIIKIILQKFKQYSIAQQDINPQFDYQSIKKAKQYYIATQYQNASPSRQEEPGFTHQYIARNKLIPFFLKIGFNPKAQSDRFYLILADSGMGKTTFMINLYFSYHSFFSKKDKPNLKLLRFSNPDTIDTIKSIKREEAKRTILLLDALDEDRGIVSTNPNVSDALTFRNRLNEIIEITRNFAEVVMTCRTQYFPGQEDDPYELEITKPDESGYYTLNKLYISPFNDKEVKRYLRKKYGYLPFINSRNKKRASRVVEESKNLIMRPMLLSYIDYLIEDDPSYRSTYQTYDTLVTKWLIRESEKRKIIIERDQFISNLKQLSQQLAKIIYFNWKKESRMYIKKDDCISIANKFEIKLRAEEITGQSLLTCDGIGNWKFAHKSIMEYFLAKEAYENPQFLSSLNFAGMDMAKKFYEELNPYIKYFEGLPAKVKSFYCTGPIDAFHFDSVLFQSNPFQRQFKICSLRDAMLYCNDLNKKNGYPPVYHIDINNPFKMYSFSNFQGKIINDVSRVRGFRLPTPFEWEFIAKCNLMELVFMEEKDTLISSKDLKIIHVNSFNEWSFDETGYFIKKFERKNKNKSDEVFSTSLSVTISSKSIKASADSFKAQRVNKYPASDFSVETTQVQDVKDTTKLKVGFRIIFVP